MWDKFADTNGEVGPMYPWRNWKHNDQTIDQLKNIIDEIKENPTSKRLVVSSWNVGELDQMSLPPCPHIFQFLVSEGKLHMHLTQRAGDLLLGVPNDLALYALLTHMVAQVTNLRPGEIIYSIADCHIYHNHIEVMKKLASITPGTMPTVVLDKRIQNIDDFEFRHIRLEEYSPSSTLTGDIAVGPLFQPFFSKEYRRIVSQEPKENLPINSRYFTKIGWSVKQASDDIEKGLRLLANVEHPIVSVFGSHKTPHNSWDYKHAYNLSRKLGEKGYAIMTGGGPGIMHAANSGAMDIGTSSIGLRSDALIEKEEGDDGALTHACLVHFLFSRRFIMSIKSELTHACLVHFLFSRRFIMSIKSDALVFYPGAYGTLTELFEDVALMSAHLVDAVPVICVGSEYWNGLFRWFSNQITSKGLADHPEKYTGFIRIEDDVGKIVEIIENSKTT